MPGKPAARLTDTTTHGSPLFPGSGSPNVLIGFLPAWRTLIDFHACPVVKGTVPDVGGVVMMGSPTVWINFQMACRVMDQVIEIPGGPNPIAMGCPTVLIGEAGTTGAGTPIGPGPYDLETSQQLFQAMANQPDIAFLFPVDGCYARAHLMVQRMQSMGADPGKAWTFAGDPNDPLWVSTPNHPDGKVEWGYHVAPTIPVQGADGVVRDMVVDPSMFDHPVTVEEWKNAQHDTPTVVQTRPGEPPIPARGGTGYWPAPDPAEGPDTHAVETMEEYKRLEGTRGK